MTEKDPAKILRTEDDLKLIWLRFRSGVGKLPVLETAVLPTRGNIVGNVSLQLLTKFIPLSLPLFIRKYSNILPHNDERRRGVCCTKF
jgi:hypothetical protein